MSETEQQATRKRPTGRRGGDSGTRQAILDAARDLFAQHGHNGASLRAIAGRAGVDTGLIRHFFGDKNGLIAATLADSTSAPEQLAAALQGDPATAGERLVGAYLDLWESPDTGPAVAAVFRSAVTSPQAADLLRETFRPRLQERVLGAETPTPADAARVSGIALAVSHLMGIAIARYVLKADPIAGMSRDELVRITGPVVQHYLTGAALT
ncbi:TetR family transcriptional regulator [Streptomyces sp. NPDC085479]|uniref:TetR/AcrR family transcriptional regulator n=1 Tax=Streptomyces sp. NPDC085479 TaxID=3365726 RepID=UPI0037D6B24A